MQRYFWLCLPQRESVNKKKNVRGEVGCLALSVAKSKLVRELQSEC